MFGKIISLATFKRILDRVSHFILCRTLVPQFHSKFVVAVFVVVVGVVVIVGVVGVVVVDFACVVDDFLLVVNAVDVVLAVAVVVDSEKVCLLHLNDVKNC